MFITLTHILYNILTTSHILQQESAQYEAVNGVHKITDKKK